MNAGRRLVGGWSEVGRRSIGRRSGAGRAPVERRSEVGGRRSVGGRSEVGRRSVGGRSVGGRSEVGRAPVRLILDTYLLYRELPLPSSCCKGEACLPRSHYQGEPRVNNCVIEWSPDRPPTGARPTSLVYSMTPN